MQISQSKTREQFPLSTKKVLKKTILGTFIWTFILFFIWVFIAIISSSESSTDSYLGIASIVIFSLMLIIILTVYLYQRWYYAVYYYDFTQDYVVIRKGPITPQEITIPYERIQDVYVNQDILDRFFGLYDVYLSSATVSSGMAAHIDGVEKPAADGLRTILLKTVSERISKNRVSTSPQTQ